MTGIALRGRKPKDITLVEGRCPVCNGPISERWAGKNPALGSQCENCPWEVKVFGPEHVVLQVEKTIHFLPLFGVYKYVYDWSGTQIQVNGQIGLIRKVQGDGALVQFSDQDTGAIGTFIHGLGYDDLIQIYEATGGETTPPALSFPEHVPQKAPLLDQHILPLLVEVDMCGNVTHIRVGNYSTMLGHMNKSPELPSLPLLHAFANFYVRFKFGLAMNHAHEGGFIGKDFSVRNAGTTIGGTGLEVQMRRLPGLEYMESANQVLAMWTAVMTVFLLFDWSRFTLDTVEDIWEHYCTMQDVIVNFLEPQEVAATLAYIKENYFEGAGTPY